ncbi:hypothetical protein [Piscinibacter koreensis]|uniref:Uncharacterized protein n=1 Tax=Piscinibacter koreensis TaxID=2742824 RepID=A0A7Y6NQT9_9BURK|nr:hypothetical protein [Schlegelella koreensis]NUZ07604.1 hypothetical protein [Schlegelella koreensis]
MDEQGNLTVDDYVPGWAERIAEAQTQTHVEIDGKLYPRRRYGSDHPDSVALQPRCGDCGVELGQLRVPTCCVERCPRCDGQAITCRCPEARLVVSQ